VRRFSSADVAPPLRDEGNIPRYWIRPTPILSAQPGLHRFVWDLRYSTPAALDFPFPIAAVPHDTPREPRGPWVMPGQYKVKLTVDGRSQTQPLAVRLDPRVKTPAAGLRQQLALSMRVVEALAKDHDAIEESRKLRADLKKLADGAAAAGPASQVAEVDRKLSALEGTPGPREPGGPPPERTPTLTGLNGRLARALGMLQAADAPPSQPLSQATEAMLKEVADLLSHWNAARAEAAAVLKR